MYRKGFHILLLTLIVIGTIAQSGGLILCYLEGDHFAVETGSGTHCQHQADFAKHSTHTVSEAYSHRHGIHIDLSLSFLDSSYLSRAAGITDIVHTPAFTALAALSPAQTVTPGNSISIAHDTTLPPYPSIDFHSTTVLLN